MSDYVWWGALLRLIQAFLQSSPFILTGLVIAGVFRRLLGYENTRRLFGEGTWRALPQAWAVGMLLPVCSLGVIPVVRELRKAGLSGGTILAFALSAPLFNPLSLLYGLTLSEPIVILSFALCSLVVITIVGLVWDRLFPQSAGEQVDSPPVPYGIKRLLAIGVHGARESVGGTALYVFAGLVGVAGMSLFLPHGFLQFAMNSDNPMAPLTMTGVAIPAYATPMLAMSQLGSMFQHGNSIGAAFALLALGAGMNLGLAAWMFRNYGFRRAVTWFALLVLVVIALSYGVQQPLQTTTAGAADHTHAFDVYCQPFHGSEANIASMVWLRIQRDAQLYELVGTGALAVLMAIGLVLRFADPNGRTEAWLESRPAEDAGEVDSAEGQVPEPQAPPQNAPVGKYDIVVPPSVLGVVSLVVIVAVSVACCYVYYPDQNEVFEELRIWHVEAISAAQEGDVEQAEHLIAVSNDWSRKLEVGTYLREWALPDYHRAKGEVFRFKLELLRHAVEDGHDDEVAELKLEVSKAYLRLSQAYRKDPTSAE